MDQKDIEENKGIAALAYLIFFIPLLAAKDSKFAKFHANQGLNLFIFAVVVNFVGSIIPFIGWFIILPLGGIFTFILFIMGIINAVNGETKKLPLIGNVEFIK